MLRRSLTFGLLGLFSLIATQAVAQVTAAPTQMNFQGRLTRPDGTPVANGTYSIRFSLWDAASGGTEKWNQTINPVTVANGTFSVRFDTNTANLFNGNLYLEIKIGTDTPLTPRQPLVSVAYAMKANTVPDGSITASKLANDALNNLSWLLNGNAANAGNFLGTTNSQPLVLKTNNAERMRVTADGKIGIGTNNPGMSLEVTAPSYYGLPAIGASTGSNYSYLHVGPVDHGLIWNSGSAMRFGTEPSRGTGFTEKMRLTSDGNLGIGTAAPTAKLHIVDSNWPSAVVSSSSTIGTWLKLINTSTGGRDWDLVSSGSGNGEGAGKLLIKDFNGGVRMLFDTNGNVGIGTFTPSSLLHVNGEITAQVLTVTGGSDVAEPYNVAGIGDIKAIPGMVVCIDGEKVGQMKVSGKAYDKTVAGIVSGANGINPGITLRQKGTIADGELPVASIGRVWCWCDADANGAIEAGDMLTTSDTPGHAMKVSDHTRANGAVIGKAMSSLKSGKGLVLVLVSLK